MQIIKVIKERKKLSFSFFHECFSCSHYDAVLMCKVVNKVLSQVFPSFLYMSGDFLASKDNGFFVFRLTSMSQAIYGRNIPSRPVPLLSTF